MDKNVLDMISNLILMMDNMNQVKCQAMEMAKMRYVLIPSCRSLVLFVFLQDQTSDNIDEMDEEESNRLRSCITAMQETLAATDDPDISLISDYFKETFDIRRNFVKTHNTTEILTEYPALQLHSCVRRNELMTNRNIFICEYLVIG